MISVCTIRPQKIKTHRKSLTTGVNLIDHRGEFITPISYLTTMKPQLKSAISDIQEINVHGSQRVLPE